MDKAEYDKFRAEQMSEDELKNAIVKEATLLGWWIHHDRPAPSRDGKRWRTHIQGHKGFPDLARVSPEGREIYAELKKEKKAYPTPEQKEWLRRLRVNHPDDVFLWRPRHWIDGTIEAELRRKT